MRASLRLSRSAIKRFCPLSARLQEGPNGGTRAYSIVDYLDDRIASSKDDNMKKLAKDLKAYHMYAKHYFAVRDKGSAEALLRIRQFGPSRSVATAC